MNRRDSFLALFALGAAPLVARAQQPAMPVIGFLSARSPAANAYLVAAFRQGLSETGFVEGRNVAIEYRWAENQYDRLPALANELVRRQVSVIAAISGTPAALAAKAATATIPIVFANGGDPITSGLVTSLNRPAGNVTGVTFLSVALAAKRLEIMHELLPTAAAMGFLVNPNNPIGKLETKDAEAAARAIGVQLHVLTASSERDIEAAFATLVQRRLSALLVGSDPLFGGSPDKFVELASRHAIPAIHQSREFAEAGGLMSYGTSQKDAYRQAGIYAAKILQGTKPADLPVMLPTRFELVLNLKTAKKLRLNISRGFLARVDEVIQ